MSSSSEDEAIQPVSTKDKELIAGLNDVEDSDSTSSSDGEEKLGAAQAMDVEDASSDESDDNYGPDFMGIGKEREAILAMAERDREELIYERMEERKKRQRRKAAKDRAKNRNKRAPRSRRDRNQAARAHHERSKWALEEIKRGKKQRKDEAEYEIEEDSDEDVEVEDDYERDLPEVEDDVVDSEDEEEVDKKPWSTETPLDLETLKRCMVRRNALERLTGEGYFEKYILGMFVRPGIGQHKGRPVYRCCRIAGMEKGQRVYTMPGGARTRYKIVCSFAGSKKAWPINVISNSGITDSEMRTWIKAMRDADLESEIPCQEELRHHRQQAEKYRNSFKYTPEVTRKLIEEKEATGWVGNLTLRIADLKGQLRRLRDKTTEDDPEKFTKLYKRLRDLEEIEATNRKTHNYTTTAGLHTINVQQARKNAERKKIIARNKKKRDRSGGTKKLDPFSRTSTVSTGMVISLKKLRAESKKRKEEQKKKEDTEKLAALEKEKAANTSIIETILSEAFVDSNSSAVEAWGQKEEDPAWAKMRDLLNTNDTRLTISVDSLQVQAPAPTPVHQLPTRYGKYLSIEKYYEKQEQQDGDDGY